MSVSTLTWLLQAAAVAHLVVALLNLSLVPILGCRDDLQRLPLLVREVFQVHLWFISFTLGIFALLTWRFAQGMASGSEPGLRWLAGAIGGFWALRTLLQVAFYSRSHWWGNTGRTLIHVACLGLYGGFAVLYFAACRTGS